LGQIDMPRLFYKLKNILIGFTVVILCFFFTNQKVLALDAVTIVSDFSSTGVTTALKTTLSAISDAAIAADSAALKLKEFVYDPAAWLASKQAQQQLTSNMLRWLGGQGTGQSGNIPFVQNYGEYDDNVADSVAGKTLTDKTLEGQCSERATFETRTEVYKWYLENYRAEEIFQCSDGSGASNRNAADSLLLAYTTCTDSVCASLKGQNKLAEKIANAQVNEARAVDNGGGFIPQRVCSGDTCKIVNPPSLVRDSVSFAVGELPGLQLLAMDEFNEIISGFMSNLTNQAITGITGVLGLSGNSEYSSNSFGENGNLSYADAMAQDDISKYQSTTQNPITDAIAIETEYLRLQNIILTEITKLENKLAQNKAEFPQCFDLELTAELVKAKQDATTNISIANTTLGILNVLDNEYKNATDGNTRNAILSTFNEYQSQGYFRTQYENQELELTYINYTFAEMVDKFKYDTAVEKYECGGDFDYTGELNPPDGVDGDNPGGGN
jgi:hypothetical protein